jgi:hypothetical protein
MRSHDARTSSISFHVTVFMCLLMSTGIARADGRAVYPAPQERCLYPVEGICIPRRTTFGYYQTHWRIWPFAGATAPRAMTAEPPKLPNGSTTLPQSELPRVKEEADRSPDLPRKADGGSSPAPDGPKQMDVDKQIDPFQDDLDGPPNAFPDTPDAAASALASPNQLAVHRGKLEEAGRVARASAPANYLLKPTSRERAAAIGQVLGRGGRSVFVTGPLDEPRVNPLRPSAGPRVKPFLPRTDSPSSDAVCTPEQSAQECVSLQQPSATVSQAVQPLPPAPSVRSHRQGKSNPLR